MKYLLPHEIKALSKEEKSEYFSKLRKKYFTEEEYKQAKKRDNRKAYLKRRGKQQ